MDGTHEREWKHGCGYIWIGKQVGGLPKLEAPGRGGEDQVNAQSGFHSFK